MTRQVWSKCLVHSYMNNVHTLTLITVQLQWCSEEWGNCCFLYKIPLAAIAENYLNIMLNSQIFPQLLILMWEASQKVLVSKFPVALEIQAVKVLIFIFSLLKLTFFIFLTLKAYKNHWNCFWYQNSPRSFPH